MLIVSACLCTLRYKLTSDSIHHDGVQSGSLDLVTRVGSLGLTDCLLEFARACQFVFDEQALCQYVPFISRETRSVRGREKTGEDQGHKHVH